VAILDNARRLVVSLALAAAVGPVSLGAQRGVEYEVKAAFIYNFIQFVMWPGTMSESSTPFRVCLYNANPFGMVLERTVRAEQVNGRPIVVERVQAGAAVSQCQILFVPQSQSDLEGVAVRAAAGSPVLTVGESPGFLRAGGMINLFVDGGRVRFDVNVAAAAARDVTISSRLLRIARNISEAGDR
jgi:hypothetical protein